MMKSNMEKIKIKIEKKDNNDISHKLRKKKYNKILNKKKKTRNRKTKNYFRFKTILFSIIIVIFVLFLIIFIQKFISRKNTNTFHKTRNNKIDYNNLLEVMNKYKNENIRLSIKQDLKFKPILSNIDFEAFNQLMNPKNIYFEFGAGGSTNVAFYYNLTVYSVESDVTWHKRLKNSGINVNYITIDLKARNLGIPGPGTTVEDWKKYIQAYKSEYNADIIYIDGRFRVACALDVFSKIRYDTR